jgi:hemoglobin-like flavoprotein
MNLEQVRLVQASFAQVLPIADVAANLFYTRLFDLDPTLRHLFPSDMQEQKRKLMLTLKFAVNSLSRLDELVPAVQDLGRRHGGYGVTPEHYETVGAALIWTLEQGLGAAFTSQVKAAWVAVYTLLANTMQQAAAQATAEAARKPMLTAALAA